jgi:hypothetical protein
LSWLNKAIGRVKYAANTTETVIAKVFISHLGTPIFYHNVRSHTQLHYWGWNNIKMQPWTMLVKPAGSCFFMEEEIDDPLAPWWREVFVYGMMHPDEEERGDDYGLWSSKPEGER